MDRGCVEEAWLLRLDLLSSGRDDQIIARYLTEVVKIRSHQPPLLHKSAQKGSLAITQEFQILRRRMATALSFSFLSTT